MPQAYNKYNNGIGTIVASNTVRFDTDSFILVLSNTAQTAGQAGQTYSVGNITEIATGGGYTQGTGITITTGSNTNTGGTYTWVGTAGLFTASGAVATFQYVIVFDNTSATKPLLGWWQCASAITMANTDTFQVSWASNQILQFS